MVKISYLTLIGLLAYSAAGHATEQFRDRMCALLNNPNTPEYMRQSLEVRCLGHAEGALKATIEDGNGVVYRFTSGSWAIVGIAPGVGENWSIYYGVKRFAFVSPDQQHSRIIDVVDTPNEESTQ